MTFSLVKHNNNSISAITSSGSLAQGRMTLLQTQTASSSASVSFTSNIDSTYPIYVFKFINIHGSVDFRHFTFQGNASGGSGYNETITSSTFEVLHDEGDSNTFLRYETSRDQGQGTSAQIIIVGIGSDNDQCGSGELILFNPSSTTFVKHFMAKGQCVQDNDHSHTLHTAGYFNTTSAIDEIQFAMSGGNIDSGTIKLYGIKGS
jgi:hypothetical protein